MKVKEGIEETFSKSVKYFNGDELAARVFSTKYALCDKSGNFYESTPDDMHKRLASEFYRIESKYTNPLSEDEIYDLLKDFKYVVPQGSPMAGIGNDYHIQSISNCFVIESPHDSYGGILKTDQELVQIAKRRGGIGFDISNIRPSGLSTGNAARTTDGIEVFMDRFSNSCREVAQGGRRGALMLTISVHHPQIRDFVKIKQNLTRVTGANISIRLSDEFMNAVKKKSSVQLRWPVNSEDPEIVEDVDADMLWHDIVKSAHTAAEPGLLFWDTAKKMTPSDIYENQGFGSVSTNPCGEIILSPYDSCRLMLVNLTSFVKDPWKVNAIFDYSHYGEIIQKAQRLMDDMVDLEIEQIEKILEKIESDPEPGSIKQIEKDLWLNIESQARLGRRTGLGVTGLGDMLAMIGQRYGSDESIETVEKVYQWLGTHAYISSMTMAKERGSFPAHDSKIETGHTFLERIFESIDNMSVDSTAPMLSNKASHMNKRFGRRNISLTTTAPAGSVSVLTQTTSGIEPAFMLHYTRRRKLTQNDDNSRVDFVDESGDSWQEYTVYHHNFNKWINQLKIGEGETMSDEKLIAMSPYACATATEIDWISKVKMQAVAQKWVCHAISNTTNLPTDATIDTVKKVYMMGWESGCKGITVYREGCRDGVLVRNTSETSSKSKAERENGVITYNDAPRRPINLPCTINHATIKGEKWTILVGLLGDRPYEIIGGLAEYIEIPKKYSEGSITKHTRKTMNSKYDLTFGEAGNEVVIKDVVSVFDNQNHSSFTRTISLAIRHGVPIQYLVEQLHKDKDADLFSLSKVIARCLKKYIIDGTKPGNGVLNCNCKTFDQRNIIYQEGCATCLTCGFAKCG